MRFWSYVFLLMVISFLAAFAFGKGLETSPALGADETDQDKALIRSTCDMYIKQVATVIGVDIDGPPIDKLPKTSTEDTLKILNIYEKWVNELDEAEGGTLYTRYRSEMQKLYISYKYGEKPLTRAAEVMQEAGCKMIPVKSA